jgi:hypothetical protein
MRLPENWFALAAMAGSIGVEPFAKLLAGLEERGKLLIDLDGVSRARISSHPCLAPLDGKSAKST